MPQPLIPGLPVEAGNAIQQDLPEPGHPTAPAAEELPVERSKFSRWLASFGLGETPIPLLRPRKQPGHPGE